MRIAVLTNFVTPYRPALFRELERRCGELRVLVSGRVDSRAQRPTEWTGLHVRLQRSVSFGGEWRHPHRFCERTAIHFPYDTIPQLIEFRPSAIVSGELGLRTLQASVFRSLNKRTRLVIWATLSEETERGRGRLRNLLRSMLLRSADAVIVNGESGARYVRSFGIPKERIFRAPQTTDVGRFLAMPAQREDRSRRRILYVGQLIERKGLMSFAADLVKWSVAHPWHYTELWIAGDGPVKEHLSLLRLPPNLSIRMLGHLSYHQLPEIYAQCGIFAFPTLADEWGLVVVEAMASGLPVLGSCYSQAVEDLVEDGRNGWVFRPDQPEEIRGALDRALCASANELDEMGSNARDKARRMTPACMAEQMISAIRYALMDDSQRS